MRAESESQGLAVRSAGGRKQIQIPGRSGPYDGGRCNELAANMSICRVGVVPQRIWGETNGSPLQKQIQNMKTKYKEHIQNSECQHPLSFPRP